MEKPCPNCHTSHASHYVACEDWTCTLCRHDCRASIARQATLESLVLTRFRELKDLMAAYDDLLKLRSPLRTMLLSRMRGCLDDVARVEGMDPQSIPEADLDRYELDEGDADDVDEDETQDALG